MRMKISDLSPDARVWIYQSGRKLNEMEKKLVLGKLEEFLDQWTAHGDQLQASASLYYDAFLVIAVEEKEVEASGCSIDKSVDFIRHLEKELNTTFLDRKKIAFLTNDEIHFETLELVKSQIKAGKIGKDNIIFNNLVRTRAQMESGWKIPLKESWLKKYLPQT